MNQADADRLDKLAKAYSTNASYCRHMAAGARNRSSKEHWVRLAGKRMKAWNKRVDYTVKYLLIGGILAAFLATAFA